MTGRNEDAGVVYVNGEYLNKSDAKVSVFDQGFIFGDGVYDTMVAKNGFLFKLEEHVDRLFNSAKAVKLTIPMSKEMVEEKIVDVVRRNGLRDAYVKCIVTRGVGKKPVMGRGDAPTPTVVIFAVPPVSVIPPEKMESGAKLVSTMIKRMPHQSIDPRVKSVNYLPNMLMRLEAIEAGADEALAYDYDGHVAEGGAENIFLVKGNALKTPAAGILEGITRQTVIEIAGSKGHEVIQTDLTQYDVYTSDEVFLCSTAGGVFPVTSVDGRIIGDGKVGKMSREIREAYDRMLSEGVHGTPIYDEDGTRPRSSAAIKRPIT
jgi:branched-chain amino acid aminotransferase